MTAQTPFQGRAGGLPFRMNRLGDGSVEFAAAYLTDLIRHAKWAAETGGDPTPGFPVLMSVIEDIAANLGEELEKHDVDRLIEQSQKVAREP